MDKEQITSAKQPTAKELSVNPDELVRELAQARASVLESIAAVEKHGNAILKISRERRQNQQTSK